MKSKLYKLIIIVLLCILFIIIVDYYNIPSRYFGVRISYFNETIFSSTISIFGSFIAGILTLLGVVITIDENNSAKEKETKRILMPMFKISSGKYNYKWKYIQFNFDLTKESMTRNRKNIEDTAVITLNFKNIGQRELRNFYLSGFKSTYLSEAYSSYQLHPIIYADDSVNINFFIYEKGIYDNDQFDEMFHTLISPISFMCLFTDCLGNSYKQEFEITIIHQLTPKKNINERALNVSIDKINILSAPEELTEIQYIEFIKDAVMCGGQ